MTDAWNAKSREGVRPERGHSKSHSMWVQYDYQALVTLRTKMMPQGDQYASLRELVPQATFHLAKLLAQVSEVAGDRQVLIGQPVLCSRAIPLFSFPLSLFLRLSLYMLTLLCSVAPVPRQIDLSGSRELQILKESEGLCWI